MPNLLNLSLNKDVLMVEGAWGLADLERLETSLEDLFNREDNKIRVVNFKDEDGIGLNILSIILEKVKAKQSNLGNETEYSFSSPNTSELFDFIKELSAEKEGAEVRRSIFYKIGLLAYDFLAESKDVLVFTGALFSDFLFDSVFKAKLRTRELISEIDKVAVSAVPIVAMVTFLIGIVISYLLGNQLQYYGANIFVVDGIATAMCRELSPILVAIILAGRSGSAFSAELGSMKMNQEVDSIRVLGLSVNQVLVIPRVLALFLCMPILVFVGDVFGILGGLFIANIHLDVGTENFLDRLQQILYLKNVYIGLLKGPLFALFIGSIACHLGLGAEPNAVSIGKNTTSTVVRSIVAVIILNAICAVVLSELKI